MIAVRDAGLAAEVAGVSPARTKLNVFALSSGLAAVCGALLAAQLQYVSVTEFDYTLSIQFIVMIIVGGVGTSWGPVIGALAISAVPLYITTYASSIPFVKQPTGSSGGFGIMAGQLSLVVYGLLLAVFLGRAAPGPGRCWPRPSCAWSGGAGPPARQAPTEAPGLAAGRPAGQYIVVFSEREGWNVVGLQIVALPSGLVPSAHDAAVTYQRNWDKQRKLPMINVRDHRR